MCWASRKERAKIRRWRRAYWRIWWAEGWRRIENICSSLTARRHSEPRWTRCSARSTHSKRRAIAHTARLPLARRPDGAALGRCRPAHDRKEFSQADGLSNRRSPPTISGTPSGFASIDPTEPEYLNEPHRTIEELKMSGVKLGPIYQNCHPMDSRMQPIYQYCQQRKLPILIHQGTTFSRKAPLKLSFPLLLEDVALAYPVTCPPKTGPVRM
jgi:hypothetical protein